LPKDRVIDVTRAIVPGKIVGLIKISYEKSKLVVSEEEIKQISNWERYLVDYAGTLWLLLYAQQNGKKYLKVCPDVFNCKGRIGYNKYVFERLFRWPMKWKDPDPEIVIDITDSVYSD
jgi:hypothetical protein